MKVIVRVTKSFKRQASLYEEYSLLRNELSILENNLIENPRIGKPLGLNSHKIRLSVKAKGRQKGGLRVITHLDTEIVRSHKGCKDWERS